MLSEWIAKLLGFAKEKLLLDERDELFARNSLLCILGADCYKENTARYNGESVSVLLNGLCQSALEEGLIGEGDFTRICDETMGALSLLPSQVQQEFDARKKVSSKEAMGWLYEYCVNCDYVKKSALDQNPRFSADNGLIVTINLAKPEFRDPKKAAAGNSVQSGYPSCTICRENEGYDGRNKRTLRTVSITLENEPWFWQFSPYGYFHEHGIAVNARHTPMHVDKGTFLKLLDFVDLFPHYFIGCNAPLPRIGGSVLSHDHFQGGGEKLPIFHAKGAVALAYPSFHAEVCVLDWFGTAVRVTGSDRGEVAALSEIVRKGWVAYSNEQQGLIPEDENGVHHAVSPTVVKTEKGYEMTLILRSNITSEQYPDGVFHAHPEFHVIKKESIGLIEAQGLFILPGRLKKELAEVESALENDAPLPENLRDYQSFYRETKELKGELGWHEAIKKQLASVCERILHNTAVFKTHEETAEFMKGIGFYEKV